MGRIAHGYRPGRSRLGSTDGINGPSHRAGAGNCALCVRPCRRTVGQRVWIGVSSAGAVALGILPHVLHHVSLFAGALFAGVGGSLLFGAVGFVAAIPFLLRVHRRTGTWRMPAALLTLFAVIFSISTFVLGPAITGDGGTNSTSSDKNTIDHTKKDNHGH